MMISSMAEHHIRTTSAPARLSLLMLLLVGLMGCSFSGGYAPVFGAGNFDGQGARTHTVQAGETLYAIAFRYGVNYHGLAKANRIKPPYVIYVNQKIRLISSPEPVQSPEPAAKQQKSARPPVVKPRPIAVAQNSTITWRWPIKGEVVNSFSLKGRINKGIDIRGKLGDKVRAAADGVVVYAGGGLRGYGKLVIVKHSDSFLSAYGHNRKIQVKEGDRVKGGQVVGEVGPSSSKQEMLHFEIRRNGKPENPLLYLPR